MAINVQWADRTYQLMVTAPPNLSSRKEKSRVLDKRKSPAAPENQRAGESIA